MAKGALEYGNSAVTGGIVTAHSAAAATATSDEIDCTGFNSIVILTDLSATGTPNWTITVTGSLASGGTFAAVKLVTTAISTGALTADSVNVFQGIPNFIKIVATENSGTGTATITVQPINL